MPAEIRTNAAPAKFTVEEKDGVVTLKRGDLEIRINENNNDVAVRTDGKVVHEQIVPPTLPGADKPLEIGDIAKDGSIYAGTLNGFRVFAAPLDLINSKAQHLTTTFNDAAKRVQRLNEGNYLGHKDWQIPAMDVMHRIRENRKTGAFATSFRDETKLTDKDYPHLYWTSTHHQKNDQVIELPLKSNEAHWENIYANNRLSTRPVRLEKI